MESFLKRCTEPLLRVFANAAQAAASEGKETIEPSHLFFGLTNQDQRMEKPRARKRNTRVNPTSASPVSVASLSLSPLSAHLLADAVRLAENYSHDAVGPEHLFISLLHHPDPGIREILKNHNVDSGAIKRQLVGIVNHTSRLLDLLEMLEREGQRSPDNTAQDPAALPGHHHHGKNPSALEFFTTELTQEYVAASIDPLIGREKEIERLMHILARRTKNNPVLVGPPGVGKTAIVEGLAKRIVEGNVPAYLKDTRLFSLNLTTLLAGAGMRGELEFRLSALIADVHKMERAILFIDELHNIVGAGGMHGSMDAGEILKPELARGTLHCIGATTQEEYKRWIEDDPALERRFQPIAVAAPTKDETKQILLGLTERYEQFHGVTIPPAALDACINLADRYITEKYFPDKAIDVIDEAAAKIKVEEQQDRVITSQVITDIISNMTGIPRALLAYEDSSRTLALEESLKKHVIGQDAAINTVARAIMRASSGLTQQGRPRASFLFLGPSGVGKTELARQLARQLFGEGALLKFDMSEFSESHTIARLLGSPSGYIGYKEGGRLTESVRHKPHSIVLFDEAEKAHPRVLNVLLQILDEGRLTDMAGREVDFSNTIIILTSNIGAAHWTTNGGTLGFESETTVGAVNQERVLADVRQWLSPELLNRINHTITFHPLLTGHLRAIANLCLDELASRVVPHHITLQWQKTLPDAIMAHNTAANKGARFIRHTIEETVEDALAQVLLRRTSEEPITLSLEYKDRAFRCRTIHNRYAKRR
ncbi:ATP-dependent Clp protease ATP-binding subunit [Candidatus Uhrbacteria bacterium]|nr:ATP-dependent Clp protease ATP-binding subunit [Candidatus Uhrbacteria bacterium]